MLSEKVLEWPRLDMLLGMLSYKPVAVAIQNNPGTFSSQRLQKQNQSCSVLKPWLVKRMIDVDYSS